MVAIDVHTHAFPDKLAERAIPKLEAAGDWKAVGPGTVDGLLESMDSADVDISVICSIATKPDQTRDILKWCKKIRSDRLEPFPSVHPADPKATKWVEKIAKAEFVGIKMHPMYQNFQVDSDEAQKVYRAAMDHDLVVTLHCGKDIAFPPEDDRAAVQRLRRIIDMYPDLRILLTHMGGWNMWDEVEELLIGTPALLETSFSSQFLQPERMCRMIRNHGVDKVCFGTDWPWNGQAAEISKLQDSGLDKSELSKVLYGNAARMLGY
ncbi:MAG: amidohydrolase family protein [Phycisphaerae bacterium]